MVFRTSNWRFSNDCFKFCEVGKVLNTNLKIKKNGFLWLSRSLGLGSIVHCSTLKLIEVVVQIKSIRLNDYHS